MVFSHSANTDKKLFCPLLTLCDKLGANMLVDQVTLDAVIEVYLCQLNLDKTSNHHLSYL